MSTVITEKDISQNPGVLPIKLGPARFQISTHVLVHYFDISNIIAEFEKLSFQHMLLDDISKNFTMFHKEFQNYFKIINFQKATIKEKLFPFIKPNRTRRGLIDGLGSIIKQITGNMDSQDSKNLNEAINTIKKNQHDLTEQINNQYSVNIEIMRKFNQSLKDIEHNEALLAKKAIEYSKVIKQTKADVDNLLAKDILNQVIHMFNMMINVIQNLENSLMFCNIHKLHPSVISHEQLFKELLKITPFYKDKMPFLVDHQNIQNYQLLMKSKCLVRNTEIIYFLSLPIFKDKLFELYYLVPTPNHNFQVIIPSQNHVLRSDSELIPLTKNCDQFDDQYLCLKSLKSYVNASCEEEILNLNKFDNCPHTQLNKDKSLEFIAELNQYLGIFPEPVSVKTTCPNKSTNKKISGVFLFEKLDDCQIFIDNQKLLFSDATKGQPLFLHDIELSLSNHQTQTVPKINLRHLQVSKLSNNIQPITETETDSNPYHVSGTAILYVIMAIIAAYFLIRRYQKKKPIEPKTDIVLEDIKI